MLELRRLLLLRELRRRGTIAAVADALQFTPSAVSQQLAALEREAGVPLLERTNRRVRLNDAGLVLAEHADALLDRAARAEADLAAAAGTPAGRARIAGFLSVLLHLALPAMRHLATSAPALRCELVEAEPEDALPALALGDVDLVLADEWQHQPWRLPPGTAREDLFDDPVFVVLPSGHPLCVERDGAVELARLADEPWTGGHVRMGWEEVIQRACRALGGFEPDIRHRTHDASVSLAIVAAGEAVTLLPALALRTAPDGVAIRPIAEGAVHRRIFAATRRTDATRPSIQALLDALRRLKPDALAQGSARPRG